MVINMKPKKIILSSLITLLILTAPGCKQEVCSSLEKIDLENTPPLSTNISTDFFFDASFSMVGYVEEPDSEYVRTLQILERSLISAWPNGGKKSFYKFGNKISNLSNRTEILKATQRPFYSDPEFNQKTRIDRVIDQAKTNNLTLIITDLFQNNADVNLLIKKLNEKFIRKDLAIGILAIKSAFIGKVYGVGIQSIAFPYSTSKLKPSKFRPFYIMMLGKYEDIRHLYENMEVNGLSQIREKNFLILSPILVRRLSTFEGSSLENISAMKELNTVLGYGESSPEVKQFYLKGFPETAYFQASIRLDTLPYSIEIDYNQIVPEIFVFHFTNGEFKQCDDANKSISTKGFLKKDSNLLLTASLKPQYFPSDGIFCYKTILRPGKKALSLPAWVSEWDMNQNLIPQWQKTPNSFDGSTTMNLKIFLNNISQIMHQKFSPKLAKLYYYIRKN